MKKAGVIVNPKRPHAPDIFDRLTRQVDELGLMLYADRQTANYLPQATVIEFDQFASTIDVMLAMGGDGTVLFCAKLLNETNIPLLGINLGSLGFLTGVSENQMETALAAYIAGTCERNVRTIADCTVLRKGVPAERYRILNDAVIGFGNSSHMTKLELTISGESVTTFTCDGMIVTTPTGSTGHFLSSGGPIIQPSANVFGISIICPHTLSSRPIILPDHHPIEITIRHAHKKLLLSADGQDVTELNEGDAVHITRSPYPVTFLQLPGYSYFSVLSQKLHWRGSSY